MAICLCLLILLHQALSVSKQTNFPIRQGIVEENGAFQLIHFMKMFFSNTRNLVNSFVYNIARFAKRFVFIESACFWKKSHDSRPR